MPSIPTKRSLRPLTTLLAAVLLSTVLAATALAPSATAIIGGTTAQTGAYPSLAYVVDFQGQLAYQCTGTVVAPSLVLTAAHCAENMQTGTPFSASGFRVVTGALDPLQAGEPVSTVLGVIVYPGLQRKVDNGDVALLVLSTPTSAPPITLASPKQAKRLVAGMPATIVGWGKTAYEQTSLDRTVAVGLDGRTSTQMVPSRCPALLRAQRDLHDYPAELRHRRVPGRQRRTPDRLRPEW